MASMSTPKIVLTEYSVDGTNSGIARLGRNSTIEASTTGISNPKFIWTLAGPGSLSSSGVYTAPLAMPSPTKVTVTATLTSNSAVSASYTMTLEYVAPALRWTTPAQLISGVTNSVAVYGYDFTPATTILVNGTAVPGTFQAPNIVVAQIPVGNVELDPVALVAQNPAPGGGNSPVMDVTVRPLAIQVNYYGKGGLNPSTNPLGRELRFVSKVTGSGNPAVNWGISWSVQGGGSITPAGIYQAPAVMPASSTVTVTCSLTARPSVHTSVQLSLVHDAPVVNESSPTQIAAGQTTSVTFTGQGFEPVTTLLLNGTAITSKFVSSSVMTASIPVSQGATAALAITAKNPSPGGGASPTLSVMIADSTKVTATIGTTPGIAIPGNYLGLSHDWNDAQSYIGSNATGVNTVYRQLVKNITNPGSTFFIRIGGGSTDTTTAPTATTVQPFVDLAKAMPVHFSLGVNLGSNNLKLAEQQASFYVAQMPAGSIEALEIGNEPDIYAREKYRPSDYSVTDYATDFTNWSKGIVAAVPSNPKLMGAAWASTWFMQQNFDSLEGALANQLPLVSQHYYAGDQGSGNTFPSYFLLQEWVAQAHVAPLQAAVKTAHGNGQTFRIGELNSIDQGGLNGVSNTFSAALWAIDVMFEYANVGVDGVNWHGINNCNYCAFNFGVSNINGKHVYTLQQVNPLYYGMLFFHQATTNSARLLPVTVSSGPNVKVWATVDKSGTAHVAVLNKDTDFAGPVSITLPGYGPGSMTRLVAPSYQSQVGISLADQTFDGSLDGTLVGTPASETVSPSGSVYVVNVQPTSAVLLTLKK